MNKKEIITTNKKHWDAIAIKNKVKKKRELSNIIRDPDAFLQRVESHLFPYLKDIEGKRVLVLQFGDAHVLFACALKGAEVTGVDFSSEYIQLAREAAKICKVNVTLVEADCQALPETIPDSSFDYAVPECGIFIWIANLNAWMSNAHLKLKKGGTLLVQDFHPLSIITKDFRVKLNDGIITLRKSYLDQTPELYLSEDDLPPAVQYNWKISDVINAQLM
uniref:Methyltransferase type 11 n=1 Tax=uncultured marine crenarchaeote E37-7F TaxID=907717 RepID=G9BAR1_9ARCH|nr:methyltransferase type 11 [uncultured marine crenarchaeote E37-7F]